MKSLRTGQAILLTCLLSACGGTVEIGGPPDGGSAGRPSTSASTGSGTTTGSGSGTTTASGSTGAGGSDPGTTGAGGSTTTTTTTSSGAGGANTTGAGGSTGTGGNPGTGGAGGGSTVCGGLRGAQCPVGNYCDYEPNAMCGAADQPGVCRPIPQGGCTADCPGVCGCDGKFYCNACGAHIAGTDDSTDKSCLRDGGTPGKICGGLGGVQCAADSFCDYAPTARCGITDASGICQLKPQVCTRDCPGVCGCDGKYYCNACIAQQAGVDESPDTSCLRDR